MIDIKSESIINQIELYLGKSISELNIEDLQSIDNLSLNNLDILGNYIEINEEEVLLFPNLDRITLTNMQLQNKTFTYLSKLSKLNKLSLINCEIIDDISNINLIKELDLLFIKDQVFDLSFLNDLKIKNLYLINTTIHNIEVLNTLKLDKLVISIELYNLNKVLFDNSKYKITVLSKNGIEEIETGV